MGVDRKLALRLTGLAWTAADGKRHETDLALEAGQIGVLSCADPRGLLLRLFDDADRSGEVILAGLPLSYWPPGERARRLRVLRPVARQLIGGDSADPSRLRGLLRKTCFAPLTNADGAALVQLAMSLADCPPGLDCLLVDGLFDTFSPPVSRAALQMLRELAQTRNTAVLLLRDAAVSATATPLLKQMADSGTDSRPGRFAR